MKNTLFLKITLVSCAFLLSVLAKANIYQVTVTTFAGAGSINQAVIDANTNPGKDTIYFSIPGAGPHTIILGADMVILGDVLIDGSSQTGYNPLAPSPVVELRNSPAMAFIVNGGASDIRTLAINNCALGLVYNTPNNRLSGCYLGLGMDGVTDSGNNGHGIIINPTSSGNIIGGTTAAQRNVISGNNNGHGIIGTASNGNYIFGNYFGTNAAGTGMVANSFMGIQMDNSSNNTIGGASLDSSNIISGNGQNGVQFIGGNANRILGNVIGLQVDKATALGNTGSGVNIINCTNTQIGGVGALSGNIIASNSGLGINLFGCTGTIIKSNIIGTSLSTQLVRGNGSHAIQLEGSRGTIIGGVHATEGNIISAGMPWGAGINFEGGGSRKSIVKGNYIGTDNTGTMAMGCDLIGIILKSDSCTIGGTAPGEGNIIVDTKKFCGLLIANANANVVTGNLIGLGLNATPLPNERDGVLIVVENAGNTASNNIVNYNTIAYNKRNGINVGRTIDAPYFINNNEVNNDLRFNSIYCNLELGIFLNLTNAADHGNNGKIAPTINNALSTSTKVVGLPNGLAATDLIDIYEMSDCMSCDINPQGKTYIATVSPDASGNWSYEPSTPISGTLIAMATDMLRNSSQFSLCFTPCEATLNLTSSANTIMMEKDKSEVINLSANETFSVLNPEPGRLFWSIGAPDTAAAVFSNSTQVELEFMTGTAMGPGLYEVYVIAKQAGCLDTAMVSLNLFFIPNLITPNGDSINDRWSVGYTAGQFDARIYNRWGDLVYNKSDYTNEWDGSGLGDGIYYFQLENKIEPDKPLKGWIQIMK